MSAQKRGRGRPKLDKRTVSIRLSDDVMARVRQASLGNISAWIERAILAQLQKERIA
jgi:post-segregation antitoxin (ccd killing protein)